MQGDAHDIQKRLAGGAQEPQVPEVGGPMPAEMANNRRLEDPPAGAGGSGCG